MKAFTIGSVVFLLVICNVLAADYKIKVKNVLTDKEENDKISIDTQKGTQVIKGGGQTSMKDMKTGYTAIKSSHKRVCMILQNDPSEQKENAEEVQKGLARMKPGEEPEVVAEAAIEIKTSNVSDEKRAEIGENLINFCGTFSIVLGEKEGEDDDDDKGEEVSEEEAKNQIAKEGKGLKGESDTQVLSGRKRGISCTFRWAWVSTKICIRYPKFHRYCKKKVWGRCVLPWIKTTWHCRYIYKPKLKWVCRN